MDLLADGAAPGISLAPGAVALAFKNGVTSGVVNAVRCRVRTGRGFRSALSAR